MPRHFSETVFKSQNCTDDMEKLEKFHHEFDDLLSARLDKLAAAGNDILSFETDVFIDIESPWLYKSATIHAVKWEE